MGRTLVRLGPGDQPTAKGLVKHSSAHVTCLNSLKPLIVLGAQTKSLASPRRDLRALAPAGLSRLIAHVLP